MMIAGDPGHGALPCDRIAFLAVMPALSRASTSFWQRLCPQVVNINPTPTG
jgi:hypothetical protein